ncbi:MAG: hypothetical protein ACK553_16330 [Planctomycetota bacterium]
MSAREARERDEPIRNPCGSSGALANRMLRKFDAIRQGELA